MTLALFACSDGGGFDVGMQSGGRPGGAGVFDDNPASTPERYISAQDQSATLNALSAGIDPRNRFVPDVFECHDIGDNDYRAPDLLVEFGVDAYSSALGSGSVGPTAGSSLPNDLRFSGGPFDGARVLVLFDDFGQSFQTAYGNGQLRCFQRGASAERAYTRFRLNTPALSEYSCRDVASGQRQPLALDASGRYVLGGQAGRFAVSDLIERDRARLDFDGGPLGGQLALYTAEERSGYQSFDVGVSTATGLYTSVDGSNAVNVVCERIGMPETFAEYGNAVLDSPTPPDTPLNGFFYRYESRSSSRSGSMNARYYRFDPDGNVFVGVPHTSGVDCRRTRPNGLPYCSRYTVEGGTVTIRSPLGQTETLAVDGTTIVRPGGEPLYPVGAVDGDAVLNRWSNFSRSRAGSASSFVENNVQFAADGRFVRTSTSQSSLVADWSSGSASVFSTANAGIIGEYAINGNLLRLRYESGRVVDRFIYRAPNDTLGIDALAYVIDNID